MEVKPAMTLEQEAAYRKLLDTVTSREKVIKTEWLDKTKDIYPIYEGQHCDTTPFNILYSNTEILVPNIFSSAPTPIVRRRFGETRADGACQAAERMAEYVMDTNLSGYPDFVDAIEACVLDAALPGQGQARVRLVDNTPCVDFVQHDQFIWGYARRWEDVPWIAYRHDKTVNDIVREFKVSEEQRAQIKVPDDAEPSNKDKGPPTLPMYEVWDKASRKVHFLCDGFPGICIQELDDPLKLTGFFPSGKPLRLLSTPISTMPRPIYDLYKQQARELNLITGRIRRVTEAIRVRGLYDGSSPDLQALFATEDLGENKIYPANNPGGMSRDGGLEKHIWLIPIERFVVVLDNLFKAREAVKSTIYEILGIGDILRGVTQASETASAQQIKDKWGSLRIKKAREKVSYFVRWHIRALIEVSANHVPEEQWAQVTGLPFISSVQAEVLKQSGGQSTQTSWPEILSILRNDFTRSYTIDIESNSTVDSAATEDKEEVTDFMNALGQSMAAVEGLASQGPQGHAAAKTLLIAICKRFRMGQEVEAAIMAIEPQPQGPTPEQEKMQEELASKEEDVKREGETVKQQFEQNKQTLDQLVEQLTKAQMELEKKAQELKLLEKQLEIKSQEMDISVREKQLELQESAATVNEQLSQRELGIKTQEAGLATKVAENKTKEADETSRVVDTKADTMAEVMEALQMQMKVVTELISSINRPFSIQKTGPGKFEKRYD